MKIYNKFHCDNLPLTYPCIDSLLENVVTQVYIFVQYFLYKYIYIFFSFAIMVEVCAYAEIDFQKRTYHVTLE